LSDCIKRLIKSTIPKEAYGLTAVAILTASAAVFANERAAFATRYYTAPDAQFTIPGALCGVEVIFFCPEEPGI